jgi:hypothetical protein
LIVLSVLFLQGCATSREATVARTDRRFELAAAVLERREDADSLAAAGLLRSSQGQPGPAVHLLTRATAAAPERPDLAWLAIRICREASTCDPEPEEARLRSLDPANGVGWLDALARADASGNAAAELTALSALGRTERVDLYWTTLIAHLTRAVVDTRKIPLPEALVYVIGVLAAQAIPAYQTTSNLCKGDRLNDAEVVESCRAVATAFERGDTSLTEMIGGAIAKRVWPADSNEWRRASEARRVYEYRSAVSMHLAFNSLADTPSAEKYLALCADNRREQDVLRAELINAGRSPDPPPDWAP